MSVARHQFKIHLDSLISVCFQYLGVDVLSLFLIKQNTRKFPKLGLRSTVRPRECRLHSCPPAPRPPPHAVPLPRAFWLSFSCSLVLFSQTLACPCVSNPFLHKKSKMSWMLFCTSGCSLQPPGTCAGGHPTPAREGLLALRPCAVPPGGPGAVRPAPPRRLGCLRMTRCNALSHDR